MDAIRALTPVYEEFLRDESRMVGSAESISFPKTEDEVAALMAYMAQRSTTVTVQGGRTGLAAGAVPFGGHIMNLSRMDGITGCRIDEQGKFFLRVQPGLVLAQLRAKIAGRKMDVRHWDEASCKAYEDLCRAPEQFFAPDPTETSATIGGMTACNASGARSFMYGPTRNHISGLRVVLADGRRVALRRGEQRAQGRRLQIKALDGSVMDLTLPAYAMPDIKNTSGYYVKDDMDAMDLFIGSDGTLGVITEIEIGLLPLPQYMWGVNCCFAAEGDALRFVRRLRHTDRAIAAIEYFDAESVSILRQQRNENPAFSRLPELPAHTSCVVFVELHTQSEEEAFRSLYHLGGILEECGGNEDDTIVACTPTDMEKLQFFRHAVPESVNMLIDQRRQKEPSITKLGTDMSVPDACLEQVMEMYRRGIADAGLQAAAWGHIGNNHVHVNILPRRKEEYQKGKRLYMQWAGQITAMGGAVSAEHGIGKLKKEYLLTMYGPEQVERMAALKKQMDPASLLGRETLFDTI